MVRSPTGALRVIPVPPLLREMLAQAMRWPLERSADALSTTFFECFAGLCAEWLSSNVRLVLPASTDRRISAIMSVTREHIDSVTLAQVCRTAGMSERSLRRHFSRCTGMSWEQYRQRLRLCLAIDSLDGGSRSVGQIAADVGYRNPAAFARAFKSVMGMTPVDYRRAACH
jgi:AraC-like DNA-binding protein